MRILFIFLAMLTFSYSSSQVIFAPTGAHWSYSFFSWPGNLQSLHIENIVVGPDTISGSDTLKILYHFKRYKNQNMCSFLLRTLIKQKGDTVFFQNDRTPGWQILYNFNCPAGQNWWTQVKDENGTIINYVTRVDSVRTVVHNNHTLKKLFVHYSGGVNGFEQFTITERFGCNLFMFNYRNIDCVSDADLIQKFLCYKDSALGVVYFTNKDCKNEERVNIKEQRLNDQNISVYPNPSTGIFKFEMTSAVNSTLTIFNSAGICIVTKEIKTEDYTIDLNGFADGIYFCTIQTHSSSYHYKLIKSFLD